MALTLTWDSAFEATPAGSTSVSAGDDRIKEFKNSTRERLNTDHIVGNATASSPDATDISNNDSGYHRQLTLKDGGSSGNPPASHIKLHNNAGQIEVLNSSGTTTYINTSSSTGVNLLSANNLSDVSNVSTSRTNLGLAIGSDVQAWDADLDTISGLSSADSNFIVGSATGWTVESGNTARTSLGLGTGNSPTFTSVTASSNLSFTGNLNSVTATEISQLETIGLTTISATQWGYLGELNQALKTTDDVTFDDITGTSLTLTTDLSITHGGTGASSASSARTNLGLAIGSDVQAYSSHLAAIDSLLKTDGNIIVANGTTYVAESGATARSSLGLTIGSDVQAWDADLDTISGLSSSDGNFIVGSATGWTVESGATARTSLGVAIGSDVQAYDAGLNDISGLAVTDGNIIVGNGTNWVAESGDTARTSLGLSIGSDVQAYDADLTAIASLSNANGNFIVGNGTSWVVESGDTARTSLGLGTGNNVQFSFLDISGGAALSAIDAIEGNLRLRDGYVDLEGSDHTVILHYIKKTSADTSLLIKRTTSNQHIIMESFTENSAMAFEFDATSTSEDTTDTSSSLGTFFFNAKKIIGGFNSTANIFCVAKEDSTKFLIKANGDLHATNTTITALDDEDDIQLVQDLRYYTGGDRYKHLTSTEGFHKLIENKILSSKGDFQIMQGVNALSLGAIGQLWNIIREVASIINISENQLKEFAKKY